MTTLRWKFNRLRLMGVREIAYRIRQQFFKKTCRFGWGVVYYPPAPNLSVFGPSFLANPAEGIDRTALLASANDLLAGYWNVFAMRAVKLGFPPEWNRDPKTGTVAPKVIGKLLDYRNEKIVGDIKYIWEPSRHLDLVTLGLAWRVSGERRYADGVKVLIESWLDDCPYPLGVHWASSLELAVRLVNWAVTWHLIGGAESLLFEGEAGAVFRQRWLDAIYQHSHFIDSYYSRHSSANNHLLGEYMGLYVASLTWPCWKETDKWRRKAKAGFEDEALRQTATDGVNKEQAIYYHHEVMDMMLLCHVSGAAAGDRFSQAFMERMERMGDFIASLMDAGGNLPMIGDADDAIMVRLSHEAEWSHYRSLLASCAMLFERPDLKALAGVLDDKNRWLFGADGHERWHRLPDQVHRPVMRFDEGGYYVMGRHWQQPGEVKAVVDCAPLGYLSIAAHGHADALAFTLSAGGEELLIDPGTFAYHTQKKWRDYFRSTAAHNTVRVDGLDQSVIGGNFMWMHKANSTLRQYVDNDRGQVFEGEHDGYRRLDDPVIHRRKIEFDSLLGIFVVSDVIVCKATHQVDIHWHIAESCSVEVNGDAVTVTSASGSSGMTISAKGLIPTLASGDEEQPSGWISRRFDKKCATTTVRYTSMVHGTTEFVTQIAVRCAESTMDADETAIRQNIVEIVE